MSADDLYLLYQRSQLRALDDAKRAADYAAWVSAIDPLQAEHWAAHAEQARRDAEAFGALMREISRFPALRAA